MIVFPFALLLTVDRIEGDVIVVELPDARVVDVPAAALPPGLREGDRVRVRSRLVRPLHASERRAPRGASPVRGRAQPAAGCAAASLGESS